MNFVDKKAGKSRLFLRLYKLLIIVNHFSITELGIFSLKVFKHKTEISNNQTRLLFRDFIYPLHLNLSIFY